MLLDFLFPQKRETEMTWNYRVIDHGGGAIMTNDELEALLEAATKGPWTQYHGDRMIICGPDGGSIGIMESGYPGVSLEEQEANAALCVALKNEAADLIAARRERDRLREALEKHDRDSLGCPVDKRGFDPTRNCPKCGARSTQSCQIKDLADRAFGTAAKAALEASHDA